VTRYGLRLLGEHFERFAHLVLQDESEAAAIALCGRSSVANPWSGEWDERFLVREIIEVPASAYFSCSPTGFTWSTAPFYHALKRAEAKDLAIAVFHSHPAGHLTFSERDDIAESELFEIAFNRLESRRPHLSVIMDRSRSLAARAYSPNLKPEAVGEIAIISEKWSFQHARRAVSISPELDRQIRAFGPASTEQLGRLRIGVVGCGGTGSAVISLLARIGVRHIALFDADRVSDTSLNRLHFATRADASLCRRKVDVVSEAIANIGLPMTIVRVPRFADHQEALNVLRACDVVFGCTDDHLGREILNRLAHFYFIPVIDVGLLIEPNDAVTYDAFDGRVTVVQPGYPCQGCRALIDGAQVYLDSLRRDPDLLVERRRAGYVPNDPDPSPVVVTFTTEVATMAVNELFHRLNGFRGPLQHCSERVRQFQYLKDSDSLPAGRRVPGCKLCDTRRYDGRGDMTPLLDINL
jgi:molybdopterin/thiamine biosynthesis adenylyltransferase